MAGGGEFLAGLLAGLSDSYREGASENRRISLMKQQLEQQNRIAEAQISLAKSAQESRERSENADRELRRLLGLGELDVSREGIAARKEEGAAARQTQLLMQDKDLNAAIQSGDKRMAHDRIMLLLQEGATIRGEKRAEVRSERERAAEEGMRGRLMEKESAIRKEESKYKSELDRAEARSKSLDDLAIRFVGRNIELNDSARQDALTFKRNMASMMAEAEAQKPGSGATLKAFLDTMADELELGRQNPETLSQEAVAALQVLQKVHDDPGAALTSIAAILGPPGSNDWGKVGQARPGMKIDLTKPPSAEPGQPGTGRTSSYRTPDSLQVGDIERVFNRNPEFAQWYYARYHEIRKRQVGGMADSYDYWMRGDIRKEQIHKLLLTEIQQAPGDTVEQRVDWIVQNKAIPELNLPAPAPISKGRSGKR